MKNVDDEFNDWPAGVTPFTPFTHTAHAVDVLTAEQLALFDDVEAAERALVNVNMTSVERQTAWNRLEDTVTRARDAGLPEQRIQDALRRADIKVLYPNRLPDHIVMPKR